MNLDKRLFDILNKQKILPLINSKNLDEDIKIIESLINVNNNLKIIEITLREKIGFLFGMNDYKKIVNKINSREFLDEFNSEKISNIKKYRKIMFFNPGQSSSTASKEIIKIIDS